MSLKHFHQVLTELKYKKINSHHYEKKNGKYLFCIDQDLGDNLLLRLLSENIINKTKCIISFPINNYSDLTEFDLIEIINSIEEEYIISINKNSV